MVKPFRVKIAQDEKPSFVRKTHMPLDVYQQWVAEGMKLPGKSQTGLAKHLGLSGPSLVSNIVNGKRKVKTTEIRAISEYLGTPPPDMEVTPSDTGLVPALVAGVASASMFREVGDFDQSEPTMMFVPADPDFPGARVLLFDVAGDSMDDLRPRPIIDGDRLQCIAYEDIAHQVPLRNGMVVIAQRTKDSGHLREWSVKQLEVLDDTVIFHPRSTNPRHKPIVVDRDAFNDGGTEVEIIAVVRNIVATLRF